MNESRKRRRQEEEAKGQRDTRHDSRKGDITPLHEAVIKKNMKSIVNILQENPAMVLMLTDTTACSPLHFAAISGCPKVLAIIISHSPPSMLFQRSQNYTFNANQMTGWVTPDEYGLVRAVNSEEFGPAGKLPLDCAILTGAEDCVTLLLSEMLKYSQNPNFCHWEMSYSPRNLVSSCLMTAVKYQRDNPRIVCDLLDHGVDIEYIDDEGLRPLHCAVVQGNVDMAKLLLQRGADPLSRGSIGSAQDIVLSAHAGHEGLHELFVHTLREL